eukprot:12460755-Heterocapsa_arctica.AAC.1
MRRFHPNLVSIFSDLYRFPFDITLRADHASRYCCTSSYYSTAVRPRTAARRRIIEVVHAELTCAGPRSSRTSGRTSSST